METDQMNRFIPCLLLLCAGMSEVTLHAQRAETAPVVEARRPQHAGPAFDAFVAREGWIFVEDLSKAQGLPDLDGTASVMEGVPALKAVDFDPATFDPRNYAITLKDNVVQPTNFRLGNRGVIQFHSPQRCQELYTRHLARKAKGQ